jgi:hypothetical protein
MEDEYRPGDSVCQVKDSQRERGPKGLWFALTTEKIGRPYVAQCEIFFGGRPLEDQNTFLRLDLGRIDARNLLQIVDRFEVAVFGAILDDRPSL